MASFLFALEIITYKVNLFHPKKEGPKSANSLNVEQFVVDQPYINIDLHFPWFFIIGPHLYMAIFDDISAVLL